MKTIVSNTGPLLHLREIGMLDMLEKAGKVIIPKAIHVELSQMDSYWIDQKPSWISLEELASGRNSKVNTLFASGLLDMGEAEAILLAQHLKADWFLTDDASARTFASAIGLEVHGTLGVVLWAAAVGYLTYDDAKRAIDGLLRSSLWISHTILQKAFKVLDEMFGE